MGKLIAAINQKLLCVRSAYMLWKGQPTCTMWYKNGISSYSLLLLMVLPTIVPRLDREDELNTKGYFP